MKTKIFLLLVTGLAVLMSGGCRIGGQPEPERVYSISPAPTFLTEELALAKARESLGLDGYKTNEWHLNELPNSQREGHYDNETWARKQLARQAPDGTLDKYFERDNANAGEIVFYKSGSRRAYHVRLEGNRLFCGYDVRP